MTHSMTKTHSTAGLSGAFSRNPTNGEVFKQYPFATAAEVDSALQSTHEAFNAWKDSSMVERVALLQRIANGLRKNAPALAELMALERG